MTGESLASYIRRLARANHLRPGYLRRYLRQPGSEGMIRLAILAGRPLPALERALAGAANGNEAGPARRHMRQADKPKLFAAIRRGARDNGLSIRALADRHGVHRRTVRQALASPWPPPRQTPQRRSRLDPFKDTIDAILLSAPSATAKQVRDRLVTEHQMTRVAYSTVRDYVADRRLPWHHGSYHQAGAAETSHEEKGRELSSETGVPPVPEALHEIVRRCRGQKLPPQPGSRWSRSSWGRQFGTHQEFLDTLPDYIDRAEATRQAQAATTPEGAVQAFLTAMIWGYGPVGYGPYRTARVLHENPGAAERLAAIARIARRDGGLAAFGDVAAQPLRYLGVAFGTKYLYFCTAASPDKPGIAPVLDAVVRRWLAEHADLRLNIDTWHTAEYERYLNTLADWSAQLSLPADTIEELIFRYGVSREGSALLAEPWTTAGESAEPEPIEIARDAWQATLELKRLFDAMEPGMASQAKPHLDALEQLILQIWPDPAAG